MQIRRLRQQTGTYKIIGQIINIPVNINNMVLQLPRQLDDDYALNVNIKKHIIHKSTYLSGQVKKHIIKEWLRYMITTPLYKHFNITINEEFLENINNRLTNETYELERIDQEQESELLLGQQHTMHWNEAKCLDIAPGQNIQPLSVIFDTYAEELSFPNIYYGQPRVIKSGVKSTPFSLATSELRRTDRRGVTPNHILYMAAKIMRLRVVQGLNFTFKMNAQTSNITRRMIENREFLDQCVENNLAFLRSIPNSVHYWANRKKEVFAMIRQLGKPTIFLTLSANEIRWPLLLKMLNKLSREGTHREINNPLSELRAIERATLVNKDPVTCCIYFEKLVLVILNIISAKSANNPFGKYRLIDYFKRIEFQNRGSPHAHLLVWLDNAPDEPISENMPKTIELITHLCSVSFDDLPQTYHDQVHKHTFTCFKRNTEKCRFNIPFWPMDRTRILLPLSNDDGRLNVLRKKADDLYTKLSERSYLSLDNFLQDNNITMPYYLDVIRSSIKRACVVFERNINQIWTNTFHPWIANILQSNMDIQYILDEYSCASYVVDYVNKSNRGISNLHRQLIELQAEHPSEDFTGLLKKLCINMINTVEMSSQEAAWYLLRQPMSRCSRSITFIPTMWPEDRHKTFKKKEQMDEEGLDEDSTDVWSTNIINKYEQRETSLEVICLAEFVSNYNWSNKKKQHILRRKPCILRFINYSMTDKFSEHKREIVTLFYPFRNEHLDILDHMKFIDIYDMHTNMLLESYAKFFKLDIDKYIAECKELNTNLQEDTDARQENIIAQHATTEANNDDIENTTTGYINAVVRERTNVMSSEEFCNIMRNTNFQQRDFLLTLLNALINEETVQVFFTGAAGSGKTFTLKLAKEITNRFAQAHNSRKNAYVACASTGKASIAIEGTTVHAAFRIAISRRTNSTMSKESIQIYRNAFAGVKVIIIDEVSMIGANMLETIDSRMREITGSFDELFGGLSVIFCGDLRQLPPVNARPIFKPTKNSICGAYIWQSLKYYSLTQIMRQRDEVFSNILTKIGNGTSLLLEEVQLIESRFFSMQWCDDNVPNAIRLFHTNSEVEKYNTDSISSHNQYSSFTCKDVFVGYNNNDELVTAKTKLYKMNVTECGGLPYILNVCIGKPYILNTNIHVEDGLVNGIIGIVKHVEYEEENNQEPKRIWIHFETPSIGQMSRIKTRPLVASKPTVLKNEWTSILQRSVTISLTKKIKCKRTQFPISPACAITIHKSQGGTFQNIVFNYNKNQDQQLVYVALSRVTSMEGLFLTNSKNDFKFYHSKQNNSPKIIELRKEIERLQLYKLPTVCDAAKQFLTNSSISIASINIQSLNAHSLDVESDEILQLPNILLLNETWLNNTHDVTIKNFSCISKFKRESIRSGGVSIYERNSNKLLKFHEGLNNNQNMTIIPCSDIGDICTAEAQINNKKVVFMSVYINCNTSLQDVEIFLTSKLLAYHKNVQNLSPLLAEKGYKTIPIVMTGDFNIDIRKPENQRFLQFMKDQFNLELKNDISSTTRGTSCIDLVFVRHISNIRCHTYISYFSYHKPILISIQIE